MTKMDDKEKKRKQETRVAVRTKAAKQKAEDTAHTARRGISRVVFSRVGIVVLLILVQLIMFVFIGNYMKAYMSYAYAAVSVIGAIALIYILSSDMNPAFQLTWALCITVFPVVGTLFFLYAKTEPLIGTMKYRISEVKTYSAHFKQQDPEVADALEASKSAHRRLAAFLYRNGRFPVYKNTHVTYFPLGEYKFKAMMEELQKAEKFIFLEYFIIDKGYMWGAILKVLREKAAEGVDVRVMYDGMNVFSNLPTSYPRRLESMGIHCRVVNSLVPFVTTVQNNRDHRKICVIDGKVGFCGGVNLADEYINRKNRFGHWKDTAVMLQGDAVESLTVMFLSTWNTIGMKMEDDFSEFLAPVSEGFDRKCGYVIPYADNPLDGDNFGEEVYFHVLNHAKKYVHIMTPYLILDREMVTTLKRVAKSGVDVKIIMPGIPDKWYAYVVAQTFFEELIESGVQIYTYTPGFVHAKVFVADDNTATVGTYNLDFRSLYLHMENGVFIYSNAEVERIELDFLRTLQKCHKVTIIDVKNRTLLTKIVGHTLRLVAPLM